MTELAIIVFLTLGGTFSLLYLVGCFACNKYGKIQGEAITVVMAFIICIVDTFILMNFFAEFFITNATACYSA